MGQKPKRMAKRFNNFAILVFMRAGACVFSISTGSEGSFMTGNILGD
jgi:hypothetical protein